MWKVCSMVKSLMTDLLRFDLWCHWGLGRHGIMPFHLTASGWESTIDWRTFFPAYLAVPYTVPLNEPNCSQVGFLLRSLKIVASVSSFEHRFGSIKDNVMGVGGIWAVWNSWALLSCQRYNKAYTIKFAEQPRRKYSGNSDEAWHNYRHRRHGHHRGVGGKALPTPSAAMEKTNTNSLLVDAKIHAIGSLKWATRKTFWKRKLFWNSFICGTCSKRARFVFEGGCRQAWFLNTIVEKQIPKEAEVDLSPYHATFRLSCYECGVNLHVQTYNVKWVSRHVK